MLEVKKKELKLKVNIKQSVIKTKFTLDERFPWIKLI